MKKITIVIVALFATNFYAQNLISKGDFEENPAPSVGTTYVEDGWYRRAGSRTPVAFASDTDYFDGTASGKFVAGSEGSARYGLNTTLEVGKRYDVSYDIKAAGAGNGVVNVFYRTGGNTFVNTVGSQAPTTTWETYSSVIRFGYEYKGSGADVTLEDSYTALAAGDMYIDIKTLAENTSDTYIDNLVITESSEQVLSVENLEVFGFSFAPNPVQDQIQLRANTEISSVKLYNAVGQEVLSQNLNSASTSVDICNLPNGVYIMKAVINNTIGTYKVIKE